MPHRADTHAAAQTRIAPSASLLTLFVTVSQPLAEGEVQRLSMTCIALTALDTLAPGVPLRSRRCTRSGRLVTAQATVRGPGGIATSSTLVSGGMMRRISFAAMMYSACAELQRAAAYESKQSREYLAGNWLETRFGCV